MARLSFLRKKWVLALVLVICVVSGWSFYNWHKDESLGVDGRKDQCAAAIAAAGDAGAYTIAVPDDSPQAVKALLAAQPLYVTGLNATPIPGDPVLAHPIRIGAASDVNACPHWLLPDYDAAGHLVALSDYVYDYPQRRARFSITGRVFPDEPRYSNPYPYLSSEQAMALLKNARGVATLQQPAPELVFLPINIGVPEQPGPAWNWRGGGAAPSDPIWLLAGADGRDYLIGTDRRVYTLHDIPLS